jgi:hypothetical protein
MRNWIGLAKLSYLISFLFLSGCAASVIQAYPGKALPLSEVAVVTCDSAIRVLSVDGNNNYRLYSGGGLYYQDCVISLLPGTHTINYQYYLSSNVMTTYSPVQSAKIDVAKGQIYRIKYTLNHSGWHTWIEKLQGKELEDQRKDVPIRIKNLSG